MDQLSELYRNAGASLGTLRLSVRDRAHLPNVGFVLASVLLKTANGKTIAMRNFLQPENDVPPSLRDAECMAETLEARHGAHAAGIAEFFSSIHTHNGDAGRAWAWAGVAKHVRRRTRERLSQ